MQNCKVKNISFDNYFILLFVSETATTIWHIGTLWKFQLAAYYGFTRTETDGRDSLGRVTVISTPFYNLKMILSPLTLNLDATDQNKSAATHGQCQVQWYNIRNEHIGLNASSHSIDGTLGLHIQFSRSISVKFMSDTRARKSECDGRGLNK